MKKIAGDAVLFALQIEPCCFINNNLLQNSRIICSVFNLY